MLTHPLIRVLGRKMTAAEKSETAEEKKKTTFFWTHFKTIDGSNPPGS